jgi:hypothetical protein
MLDDVYIGPAPSRPVRVSAPFTDQSTFLFMPNGVVETYCNRSGALHFGPAADRAPYQYLLTNTINITGPTTTIQFDLTVGCLGRDLSSTPFAIDVLYTDDAGVGTASPPTTRSGPWRYALSAVCSRVGSCTTGPLAPPPANVSSTGNVSYGTATSGGQLFSLDYTSDPWNRAWTRITFSVALPPNIARRFRFVAQRAAGATTDWAISNLYIGSDCGGCGGRGTCQPSGCACDTGTFYNTATQTCDIVSAPTSLLERFDSSTLSSSLWSVASGGAVSSAYVVSGAAAFYFTGSNTRRLVTADLDTRTATTAQFSLRLASPSSPVVFLYSLDAGLTWINILTSVAQTTSATGFYAVPLPAAARALGVRFMWWQPVYSAAGNDFWVSVDSVGL